MSDNTPRDLLMAVVRLRLGFAVVGARARAAAGRRPGLTAAQTAVEGARTQGGRVAIAMGVRVAGVTVKRRIRNGITICGDEA